MQNPGTVKADRLGKKNVARAVLKELRSQVATVTMHAIFIVSGDRTMMMLFAIAAVVLVGFGLFAWRYEAATGGTGGIARLLHDRLILARKSRDAKGRRNSMSGR
jgi:hypothetical protein